MKMNNVNGNSEMRTLSTWYVGVCNR